MPLAPRILAPRILAPRILAPRILAPRILAPRILAPRILAPRILAPRILAPRILALDVRNRTISVGIRAAYPRGAYLREDTRRGATGSWLALRRLGSIVERTSDEYAILLREIAREACQSPGAESPTAALGGDAGPGDGTPGPAGAAPPGFGIGEAWLSSVVPALTPRLCEAVETAFGLACSIVGPGLKTGVKIRTDVPSEVGADLVCAAAAARELVGGPCVIVDFGAALSFSAVNAAGEFLGCAIAPGIEAAAGTLRAVAAQIPEVRMEAPPRAIGRTTAQSVQAGIILGYGGLVERLIDLVGAEMRAMRETEAPGEGQIPIEIIGTGERVGRGILASLGYDRFEPDLALEGLAIIASRNAR